MSSKLFIIVALALTIVSFVYACSVPRGWKPKSLAERAKSAEIVLYGKVIHSPSRWYYSEHRKAPILKKKEGIYSAELEIYCIYKGDIYQRFLNISGYGYLPGYCVDDHVVEGEKGIFFVRYDRSGQLVAHNVNVQRSTASADTGTLKRVAKATEISLRKASVLSHRPKRLRSGCWY